MYGRDFWATDLRKVWGKSWIHATYITDACNPSNREILKITDQLPHLRTRHVADRLNQVVIHARTGMLMKAPWEQYMLHMRAYPFKGVKFHGHNPQSWILYVLNTFALAVDAFDPLNPSQ